MKIIEALKQIKDLSRKCSDLAEKVKQYSADLDFETTVYPDQTAQVQEWVQSHTDTIKEIARLRVAIQRTNILTMVKIALDGNVIEKSIAEWIHWRRDLAKSQETLYKQLTDRNLKEGAVQQSNGQVMNVKIRRYYDPKTRDKMIELYRSEPSIIDATLEVINATIDLME